MKFAFPPMKAIASAAVACVVLAGCATGGDQAGSASAKNARTDELIQPIEPAKVENPALVELGKKLFFEPRLSRSGALTCNSCHNLSRGGSDNMAFSIGDYWQQGGIHSPTVLNSSLNIAQFWDGRAKTLAEQAAGPIANPVEMGFTHDLAVSMLETIPGYRAEFKQVFGVDKINIDQITKALEAFEQTLVTPNSRFDQWLRGDDKAINAQELKGYQLFVESGCVACHNGPAVGGNSFQRMGVVEPYKSDLAVDGRAAVTGDDADRFNFKVPTLRNVELTYPYFHDGAAKTLPEAVDIMGRLQLGKKFTPEENADIVAFLKTLTGDQPNFSIPHLPPSGDKTPRPNPFEKPANKG